jgi:hypothetical protein
MIFFGRLETFYNGKECAGGGMEIVFVCESTEDFFLPPHAPLMSIKDYYMPECTVSKEKN